MATNLVAPTCLPLTTNHGNTYMSAIGNKHGNTYMFATSNKILHKSFLIYNNKLVATNMCVQGSLPSNGNTYIYEQHNVIKLQ